MLSAKQIGTRLRSARDALGLTQTEVAKLIGLTHVGYGYYERGERLIGVEYLEPLSKALGRPIAYFLGISGNPRLTPDEDALIMHYRQIPDDRKDLVLDVVRTIAARSQEES